MKKSVARFFVLVLFLVSGNSFAQKFTEFTEDSLKYIKELDAYFQDGSANKDEAAKFIKDFEKFWKSPEFPSKYRQYIYTTSNKMLLKRMKPYPFYHDYIVSVANFIDSKRDFDDFKGWQLIIDKILSGKGIKAYSEFLEMSLNLFESNTFYKTPSYSWYTLQGEFKFEFDSLPKLTLPKFTLVCKNPREDSLAIEGIEGSYYPSSGRFIGKGGKVSWKRTGLNDDVFAILKKVNIDCKLGGYTTDSAFFQHPGYFDKPQLGKLNDKVVSENQGLTYPRFDTYTKRILVKNVLKDVDYEGGFSMRGPKFVGSGDSKNPAQIIFRRNGQPFLKLGSRNFAMSSDKITSETASVKFFLEKDSIVHPGLSFKYLADQRKVSLIRTDDGMQKTPYTDTYHKVDMYFEELIWKIDSPKIDMGFIANNFQGQAYFESQDFFTSARMEQLSDGETNPVSKINQFYEKNKTKSFTAVDLAKFMKWTAIDLRPVLFKIAAFGLISYDPETDEILIKDKLFKYILANKKQSDYDIITIHSVYPGLTNATINLLNNNYDMRINGVKELLLSDTQQVFVFPAKQVLVLKKGRKMTFSGVVAAGKFEFHGKEFSYDYDLNKVDLKNVDSLRIYVTALEPDINGNYPMKRVKTVIENINGELLVDAPTNHAGFKKAPAFPIFKSFKESYAFYDKRNIQRGVYNKDKFYFKLDPYVIDSVDNFTNEALIFDGEFVSAGIFPSFREKLTLQQDYSLGFIRKAPPGGYQVYGGKAKFENEIRLSNKGLRGDGDITFGPSKIKSDDFIFFPDSMNAIAQTFDVQETVSPDEFPQAHGDNVYIHWMPYKDLLQASDRAEPFTAYNKQATFKGRFDLSPTELYGRGKVDFERADLLSQKILFKQKKFFSDTANFHLKAFDEEGFTFSTKNVNATIDFENRVGTFISNGSQSLVEFNKNQYVAKMDRFKWYMDSENIQLGDDQKKIDVSNESALDLEGPEFISVHPKQDSLRFFAPAANYNLRKYVISCINVPFVNVADARFFPDSGKVTIFRNAVMDTLRNAVIMANVVTKYHNIKKVKGNIYGKKSYLANGEYTYLDENNNPYLIRFAKIAPDSSGQTISEGFIPDSSKFKFNPYFSFAGKVKLMASNEFLTFDGGTQIVHNCGRVRKAYLKFKGEIDPKEIFIPIDSVLFDVKNTEVGSGILYSNDSSKVYSAFISPVINEKRDKNVISASGFMYYDKESAEYRIGSKEKIIETSLPGNYMSLNTNTCEVYGEGKLDLGASLGQVEMKTVGSALHTTVNDSSAFNVMATINFYFEDKALKKLVEDIEVYTNTLPAVDFQTSEFKKGMAELMGKEKADKAISELELNGEYKRFPDELEKSLFITGMSMRYDKKNKWFISEGGIGLGNILKNEINKKVKGYIVVQKVKGKSDRLYVYIELDQNTWYYFTYFNGNMQAVSSNQEFNTIIKEVKSKNRKKDVDKGPSYQYNPANPTAAKLFLKKLKSTEVEEQ